MRRRQMQLWQHVLFGIIAIVLIVSISIGGYMFQRWWNYTWSYEASVKQTICEMVKPEHLIRPCK